MTYIIYNYIIINIILLQVKQHLYLKSSLELTE